MVEGGGGSVTNYIWKLTKATQLLQRKVLRSKCSQYVAKLQGIPGPPEGQGEMSL